MILRYQKGDWRYRRPDHWGSFARYTSQLDSRGHEGKDLRGSAPSFFDGVRHIGLIFRSRGSSFRGGALRIGEETRDFSS